MFTLTLRQPAASLSELHVRNCFLLGFDAITVFATFRFIKAPAVHSATERYFAAEILERSPQHALLYKKTRLTWFEFKS
jgi:hypothetical protein